MQERETKTENRGKSRKGTPAKGRIASIFSFFAILILLAALAFGGAYLFRKKQLKDNPPPLLESSREILPESLSGQR